MILNDNIVLDYINLHKRVKWELRDINIINYLLNRYNNFTVTDTYLKCREAVHRLKNNIENPPTCQVCGKILKYRNVTGRSSYEVACCPEHIKIVSTKNQQETNLKKFGTVSPLQNEKIKEKTIQTMIHKYGAPYIALTLYWKESVNKTSLKKYNTIYPNLAECVKDKIKNTLYLHYGVDNYFKTPEAKFKANTKESILKGIETKRKNNTLNTSKPEDYVYTLLSLKYNTVLRLYRSDEYPYHCDFYIPEIKLYLECNFHWTHGYHKFNELDSNDIHTLLIWKNKAEKSNFYKTAIYVWTILDVKKRNTAKQNNLNYIEIYNISEINKILNNETID